MAIPLNATAGSTANWSRKKVPTGWVMVKEDYFKCGNVKIHLIMKEFDHPSNTRDALKVLKESLR